MRVKLIAALIGALIVVGGGAGAHTSVFEKSADHASASLTVEVVGEVKTSDDDLGCVDGKENLSSDLCAQWTAAKAARDSADKASKAVEVSKAANWIALVGTVAASAAAFGAGFSVLYARRTLHSDRAWVTFHSCEVDQIGDRIRCVFVWENSGRSPALHVKIWTAHRRGFGALPIIGRSDAVLSEVSEPVLANGHRRDAPPIFIPAFPADGDVPFAEQEQYFYCWVEYEDVFERKKRESVSCRVLNHTHPCDQTTLAVGPMNYVR